MRRISETSVIRLIYIYLFLLLVAGCSLEKKSAVNRGLQNLTAHYNILFNANEILRQKQESYALSFVDSYNDILSVYQDTTPKPAAPDKDLEEAKAKAGKIINIKEQSHYIPDAYLVLGKANFLEGDYFQAAEFFSYVIRSFPKQPKLTEEATVWKARTLIYLNQLPQAKLVADSAIQNINKKTKKSIIADAYATKLQYDINVQSYIEAEEMARQAIHYCRTKKQRLRWTFIMAQLQELNNKPKDAYTNYTHIMNSNADFEMAFNASLNRIRIEENATGVKESRIDKLRQLIKNENNKDYLDQIYYQIGDLYLVSKDLDNAIKNYHLSTHHSRKNQNQKGMSYLRLADIYFTNKADYPRAKKYYDSTLLNLSPTYPGYQVIKKKNDNLQLLTDRLETIAREDTLQMLAKLDDKTRAKRIDAMVNREILQQQAQAMAQAPATESSGAGPQTGGTSASTFYFYNSNAVSQGYNDFKRKWGNRKLEDNWRRSSRASSDITSASSQNLDPDATVGQMTKNQNATSAGAYRKQLTDNLPLTPALLAQSNQRIYNAYFDIANFYRDILGDKKDAIATDELLISRFPNTPDKPAIYYNLYRLYSDVDPAKSEQYKNLLLKEFPETAFAKIVVDPNYIKNLTDSDAEINGLYNNVYDSFAKKDYQNTITLIDQLQKQRPGNKWSAQLAYLRAISAGHLEKLDAFKTDLTDILNKYPSDKLIIPLVQQHLAYVNSHQAAMEARPFALTDKDPNEEPFVPPVEETKAVGIADYNAFAEHQQQAAKQAQAARDAAAKQAAAKNAATNPAGNKQPALNNPANNNPAKKASSIFSMLDSTNYYFVVNVSSGTTNLASSRFGIGQFNRANFPDGSVTHQLMSVGDDNQLIFVGRFYTIGNVKDYARAIIPLMPDIMKVPKEKYSFFIITKENLDKLTTKAMLDSYMDYYQNNY